VAKPPTLRAGQKKAGAVLGLRLERHQAIEKCWSSRAAKAQASRTSMGPLDSQKLGNRMSNIHELKTNRHTADRLADVREKIKTLKLEEEQLRQALIASPEDRKGDQWIAKVSERNGAKYDIAAIVKHYGTAALAPFKHDNWVTYVRLKPRVFPVKHEANP
jgi:hypothetical protein